MTDVAPALAKQTQADPVSCYLRAILLGAIVALTYAVIAHRLGYSAPLGLLFGPANDLFADYFKFILSFPGGDHVSPNSVFGLTELDIHPPARNPYHGIDGLHEGGLNHLGMPLMVLFCLISVKAMHFIGGGGAFVVTYSLLALYWAKIAMGWARTRDESLSWFLIGLLSYPALMIIARGNVYSGFAGVMLIHAMLLGARRSAPVLAAVLLATVINLRPNVILFGLPLLFFYWPQVRRLVPLFCLVGGGVFLASLVLANHLYPDYTFRSFSAALGFYYRGYVVGDGGLAMGSSLYGALKFLFGYEPGLDTIALLPSLAILLLGAWGWISGRLTDAALLFLVTAAYCLGSSVIADYHLLVFIVPLMVWAREPATSSTALASRIAQVACCLLLISKNFIARGEVSYQVVLNPAVLLASAGIMLFLVLRAAPATPPDRRLVNAST